MTHIENWLEIDTESIRNNIHLLRNIAECPVMAVVKANAYGHGAVGVAKAAHAAGAAFFCVARFREALELRQAGIDEPILLFGKLSPEDVLTAAAQNVRATIFSAEQITEYTQLLDGSGLHLTVHVKVDTGMGRLGTDIASAVALLAQIRQEKTLQAEGLYTHFACSDELNNAVTSQQLDRMETLIDQISATGYRPPIVHAANSAGILFHARARRFDMVRAGIALYGLAPAPDAPLPEGFRPVLSWKAPVISVRSFEAGHGISYGHHYHTQRDHEKIGVLSVGYADGFRRVTGNEVILRGQRVPVVGTVCMDQCMVQLDHIPDACPGDEAILIGQDGEQEISVDDVAARWGTINYEVTSGISHRIDRVFKESAADA